MMSRTVKATALRESCEHVGLNVTKCTLWPVLYPVAEGLDDIFFEMIGAGVCMHDSLAISLACFDKKSGSHPQCG
jgi:hypothetical protein